MEYSRFWKNDNFEDIGLFKASFKKFSYSKHWHDEYAIGLIQKGVEGLHFYGNKVLIPQNHIVAINPGEVHTGFSGAQNGWEYRMFYFNQELISKILEPKKILNLPSITSTLIKDDELFKNLLNLHISLEKKSFSLAKDSLLLSSIVELFSKHSNVKIKSDKSYKDGFNNKKIKEYLLCNYKENITLKELATLINKDEYQVIRSFKKQWGITPHQFLIFIKTKKSKELLEKGFDLTFSALDSGFYDQSHFGKNFKLIYGITPRNYQLSYLNN